MAFTYENEDHSEEEEDSESEDEEMPVAVARENATYNTVGLHEKLEDIEWTGEADWLQTLVVTHPDQAVEQVDANDDLAREMAFYTQALEGVKVAYLKLQEAGIPFLRPSDYYAEMVKSDAHMLKVKDKLLHEQKSLEEVEQRRKQRDAKKYSKEVQAEKLKERAKTKKESIESVKKWRKLRQNSDFTEGGDDFPVALDEHDDARPSRGRSQGPGDRSTPKFGQGAGGASKRRLSRDSKFGFGGRKRLSKQNTAESSGDMTGYKGSYKEAGWGGLKGKAARGGKSGRGGTRGRGKQRPGKERRKSEKGRGGK